MLLNSFFSFVVVISIIVFVHEMGHYLVAKYYGVRIEEFSIGFGRKLFGIRDKSGTLWKICLIPLGGYVKMYGDANPASTEAIQIPEYLKKISFTHQKPLNRFFISFAGPFANYILAFAIFVGIFLVNGKAETSPKIDGVVENSPAFNAGLKKGDIISYVNGNKIKEFADIYENIALRPNQEIELRVIRNNNEYRVTLTTGEREILDSKGRVLGKVGSIGVMSESPKLVSLNFMESVNYSIKLIISLSKSTLISLKQMIVGERSLDELRGAVTIAEQSAETVSKGLTAFAFHIAMLSVNIGFVNLLPVPILDGGHMVFSLYEIIVGRRPNKKVQNILNILGLIFIIFMFVISTSNDIKALISK